MTKVEYRTIRFIEHKHVVRMQFMGVYSADIARSELDAIGQWSICDGGMVFEGVSETKVVNKLQALVDRTFPRVVSDITGNKLFFVHEHSGVPLLGSGYFGLVDRDTNLIEVKMSTGCNLNCVYCSVNEGIRSRMRDIVVDADYLAEELRSLISMKGSDDIEVHIGCQGEPMLYSDIYYLVRLIAKIPQVKRVSMDTNGTLLTPEKIDALIKTGMTQFNISLNAIDTKTGWKMAGLRFEHDHVKEMCRYISASQAGLVIAPVLVPGYNEQEIEALIEFGKSLGAKMGVQNFLNYKGGRNPVKQWEWKKFYDTLTVLEEKYGLKLKLTAADFGIFKLRVLDKPFRKGDVVRAEVIGPGRFRGEVLCKAGGRVISVYGNVGNKLRVNVKITRDKHNIFVGRI